MPLTYSAVHSHTTDALAYNGVASNTYFCLSKNSQQFPQQPQGNTNSSQQCKALRCSNPYLWRRRNFSCL